MDIKEAYKVMQAEWLKVNDVRVGDTVWALRQAKSNECGWGACWNTPGMDRYIGKKMTVKDIDEKWIKTDSGFNFPFFVLEIIEQPREKEDMIDVDGKMFSKSTIKEALKKHAE